MPSIEDKLMTASQIKEVTDTKLDKDFSSLDTSGGFSLTDELAVNISGSPYRITGRTLANAIGGGGTEQAALTNYVKNCGTISSLPATFTDSNITADMIVIEYTVGDESAVGSDWTVTTSDGSFTIAGTLAKSTSLSIVFGVGYSTTPSILTNLASDSPDNILKASPRPGVTGVLPLVNGGVGSSTAAGARTNLDVYSKSETNSAIQQSTAFFVDVDTLAELESALVTKWSAMSNGGSIQGSVWTTFSNASMGFNSGVYTVALFRRTNGVYLATFITTTATVISDYYYSGVHHWSSQLSDKAVVSDLTGAASGVTTHGNYVYDPSAQTVRIYLASRSANDMGPSTVLANIPAAYRPKSTVYLVGFYTTGGSGVAYQGRVETNGNVTQTLGSSVREAIIVGEYSIAQ